MKLATFRKYGVEVTFQDNSEELKKMLSEAIKEGLEECGKVARRYAQAELRKPKAHKNGEIKPNIITSTLHDSIEYEVEKQNLYVGVNKDVIYATYVEFGTRRSWAYPYLTPAMMNHKEQYKNILKRTLRKDSNFPFSVPPLIKSN